MLAGLAAKLIGIQIRGGVHLGAVGFAGDHGPAVQVPGIGQRSGGRSRKL